MGWWVAWDVAKRREAFEDTGLDGSGSLMAALWSELGRLRRGMVVEQQKGEGRGQSAFAVGSGRSWMGRNEEVGYRI